MGINGGDYLTLQNFYSAVIVDVPVAAAALPATTVYPGRVNSTIFIQRIVRGFGTHVAGAVTTVQGDAPTPVPLVTHADVAEGVGVLDSVTWDFGPNGIPLREGEGISVIANTGGSGSTGSLHIEGYRRVTAVTHMGTPNTEN